MSDIACSVFDFWENAGERLGVDPAVFLEGTGLTLEHVRTPRAFMTWEQYAALLENLVRRVGGHEALQALSRDLMPKYRFVAPLRAVGAGLGSPSALYHFAVRWTGPSLYRCARFSVASGAEGRLRVVVDLPPDRVGSRAALVAYWGALERLPSYLGLPDAHVAAELTDHTGIYEITLPRGVPLWARLTRALRGAEATDAAVAQIVAIQREVSDVHEALDRTERDFRAVLERLPDAVVLYRSRGTHLWSNTAWQDRFGVARGVDHLVDVAEPVARPALRAHLEGVATGMLRVRLHDASGAARHVECSIPVPVRFGGVDARLLVVRDVTEQVALEEARRRSEEMSAALLRGLPDHVVRMEADGRIGAVTGSALPIPTLAPDDAGKASVDLLDRSNPFTPETLDQVVAALGRAHATGEVQRIEYRPVHDDEVWLELRIVPVEGGATLFVTRDLTERRKLERQVAVADRLASVGTLAAGVAHEVNNPLTYVLDRLRRVRERVAGTSDEGLVRAAAEAWEGAERVRQIVRDLSTFARHEEEARGPVDLVAVAQAMVRMAQPEIRYRARVEWDVHPVPPVLGDASRVAQLVLNLVVNAAQAIPEGAASDHAIRLVVRPGDGGTVVLEVTDTGVGIAEHHLERIFEPFFRAKGGEGSGMGLAICRGIVERMGGRIEVESRRDLGSTFRVTLPEAPSDAAAPPPPDPPVAAPRPARVLVIDDEPLVADVLAEMLSGHDVTTAYHGAEALEAIRRDPVYDVIFCDLMMPQMSGMDLYDRLTTEAPEQARRMVFVTGGLFTERARAFVGRVPNPTLGKPFRAAEVLALVSRLVGA